VVQEQTLYQAAPERLLDERDQAGPDEQREQQGRGRRAAPGHCELGGCRRARAADCAEHDDRAPPGEPRQDTDRETGRRRASHATRIEQACKQGALLAQGRRQHQRQERRNDEVTDVPGDRDVVSALSQSQLPHRPQDEHERFDEKDSDDRRPAARHARSRGGWASRSYPGGAARYSGLSRQFDGIRRPWLPRAGDGWLADPARFLPGKRMAIPGISDASDRNNLIAYLLGAEIPGPD